MHLDISDANYQFSKTFEKGWPAVGQLGLVPASQEPGEGVCYKQEPSKEKSYKYEEEKPNPGTWRKVVRFPD